MKAVLDDQKRSIGAAEESEKRATDTATQLKTSLQRNSETKADGKTPVSRSIKMEKQLSEPKTATDDTLRQLTEMAKRVELLEGKAVVLTLQLSKTEKVRDASVSGRMNG